MNFDFPYEDDDLVFDEVLSEYNANSINSQAIKSKYNDFRHIGYKNIKFKNPLLKEIDMETKKIESYFFSKLEEFPKIFEGKNFYSFQDALDYLKSISIPNKCVCAGIIDNIPGWRCVECSIYENSIYCSKCFIKSKELHKNHKVEFLNSSGGMCDCGDPDALYTYCSEHCGPYTEQKQIDEYINKVIPENILKNIKVFLDDLFYQFTKYLILTEKWKLFYDYLLNSKDKKGEDDIAVTIDLKNYFSVIFKNFINFLRKITENNLAMLHIIASYFLKNNLDEKLATENKEKDKWNTTHSCIKITPDNIEILYKDKNANKNILSSMNFSGVTKHKCECPFLRLLISNYRNTIKSLDPDETEDEKFFLSFTHNLFLRKTMCYILFFLYKEIILNSSQTIIYVRNQFFIEDALVTIAEKTNLIEESFIFLHDYIKNFFENNKKNFDFGRINHFELNNLLNAIKIYMIDCKYFSKPKVLQLMYSKINIYKVLIDLLGLFHNQMNFKSIVPHPAFQSKKEIIELVDTELFILNVINMMLLCIDWKNIEKIKEIFHYLVDKILSLNKNIILGKNEYTYHITIYKYFGAFINSFCFNYAIDNNTNINEALEFAKNNLFRSKDEMNKIVSIILDEYYKFYGFIMGIRNGFFNYYELNNYNFIYFNDKRYLLKDLVLLKYLFAMTEKPIKLDTILEKANVEDIYQIFKSIFDLTLNPDTSNSTNTNQNPTGFFGFLRHPISFISSYFIKNPKSSIECESDENKVVIQWRRILEMIISILKNDSTLIIEILFFYNDSISLKTKNNFFERFKKNKYIMHDCRNILKQNLILTIIANGNLMDLEQIQKTTYKFYFTLFDNNEFNEILNEVAFHKINGEKKQFYLKDTTLKYLDLNYYYSPMTRSKAELYLNDFKKDSFKIYNSYYYSPSELTFDLYNKAYENIFLCVENIEFLTNILKILLNPEYDVRMKKYNSNSIRAIMLPIIFNFLSMFGDINSTSFYNFKIKNENLITNICNILNDVLNANKENKHLDSDLEDNILDLIKQLNSYQTIKEYITGGLFKLSDKSYNNDEEELRINFEKSGGKQKNNKGEISSKENEKKNKMKNMKDKLKNLMKQKSEKFIDKAKKDKKMKKIINTQEKDEEISDNNNDEIMCFYCRNSINLSSYEKPYGKLGLIVDDYFYYNSIISTFNSKMNQILEKENNNSIKENSLNIIKNMKERRSKNSIINSCGHYVHLSCFNKGKTKDGFKCPLCEKIQNILIPPLNNFYNKENFFKPLLSLKDILYKKTDMKNNNIIQDDFKNIIIDFLIDIKMNITSVKFNIFIKTLISKYQSYINYLTNLIYCNAITFYKHQQIVIIRNLILSIRYLIHINFIDINDVLKYIHQLLIEIKTNVKSDFRPYDISHYKSLFDELIFCFCILLSYDEIKKSFIFLINLTLPFICYFMYLRNLVIKNDLTTLDIKNSKQELSCEDIKKYLNENNTDIINYFKKFLHKFYIIQIITNLDVKEDNIENNLKNLSIDKLFSLLNLENIYQSLSKNGKDEIIFSDLLNKIPELLSSQDYFIKDMVLDYDKVFNSLINKTKNYKKDSSELVEADFIIQFIPYEFKLISLDNQIFDFFEKYIFEKCDICKKETKYYYVCLICGKKVCATTICDLAQIHIKNCSGNLGLFVYITDMKLRLINLTQNSKILYPLYVNESGIGPDNTNKGREFKLSKENYESALKEYISLDTKIKYI